jgi:hypothetical protein
MITEDLVPFPGPKSSVIMEAPQETRPARQPRAGTGGSRALETSMRWLAEQAGRLRTSRLTGTSQTLPDHEKVTGACER